MALLRVCLLTLACVGGGALGCTTRFFSRFSEDEPSLLIAIGGTTEGYVGSSRVEIIKNDGLCYGHRLTLPFPICHHRAVLVSLEEKIIVCGGRQRKNENVTNCGSADFDPGCLVWKKGDGRFTPLNTFISRLPKLPIGAKSANFDFQHKKNDTVYYRLWSTNNFWKARVDISDKLVWVARMDFPVNSAYGCSMIFKGMLYIVGGIWMDKSFQLHTTASMYRYVENGDEEVGWQKMQSMPRGLYNMTCIPTNNAILVIGGQVLNDSDPDATAKSVMFWHPETNQWTLNDSIHAPMHEARYGFGLGILQGSSGNKRLLAFGGYNALAKTSPNKFLSSTEEFDPVSNTWIWPQFTLEEAKSDMAVVSVPESWIEECSSSSHQRSAARSLPVISLFLQLCWSLVAAAAVIFSHGLQCN